MTSHVFGDELDWFTINPACSNVLAQQRSPAVLLFGLVQQFDFIFSGLLIVLLYLLHLVGGGPLPRDTTHSCQSKPARAFLRSKPAHRETFTYIFVQRLDGLQIHHRVVHSENS